MKATKILSRVALMTDDQRAVAIDCALPKRIPPNASTTLSDYHQVLLEGMNHQRTFENSSSVGYRVSKKKAQVCSPPVTYMGCELREGKRLLSQTSIAAILQNPTPTTKKQVWEFLAVGYCFRYLGSLKLPNPCTMARGNPLGVGPRNMNRPLRT